jgi:hypothetical protein
MIGNAMLVHMDLLRQDLSYTGRMVRRSPSFAITAAIIVAIGIGATTAAFSVTDFVLLRPLPFPEPDRLVKLWERTPGYGHMELSAANYRDWKQGAPFREHRAVSQRGRQSRWPERAVAPRGRGGFRRSISRLWACSP